MKIIVTEEHIERGERGSRKCCAIALAAAEAECEDVTVGLNSMGFSKDGKRYSAYLPYNAREFVRNFDNNIHVLCVEPFEFDLTDIEEVYED